MRVAVITDEELPKTLHGFKLKAISWDSDKLEDVNLRDYDGVVVDIDSYNRLDNITMPIDFESDTLTPTIVYDVLKTSPSFFVLLGDPSQAIYNKDFLSAVGFTGEYIKGRGTAHSITEAGQKSIFKDYLTEIKSYNFAYNFPLDTAHELISKVQLGRYVHYRTMITPLMATKSDHFTAFQMQGKAYSVDHLNREDDRIFLYENRPTFLPSHPKGINHALEVLLLSIKNSDSDVDTHEPGWTLNMQVSGQDEIDAEITAKSEIIEAAVAERNTFETKRTEMRKILEIIYLADKPLEGSLKRSFQEVGYTIREPEENNNVEFYLTHKKLEFVVEVKSTSKAHFNKEGLRQVNEWRENEALENAKEYKPLLILSNEYDKPIEERNAEDILDENLLGYAVTRGIAVVTTPTLFTSFQLIADGKLSATKLIETLHSNVGMVTINDIKA